MGGFIFALAHVILSPQVLAMSYTQLASETNCQAATGKAMFLTVWSIVITIIVVGGVFRLSWGMRRWINRLFIKRDSEGQPIEQTFMAKSTFGNLAPDAALLASLGKNATPEKSLNDTILRPTIGVRLISFGASGLLIWMLWFSGQEYLPRYLYLYEATTSVVIYSLVYTNMYSLRYDRYGFSHRNGAFQEVDFAWKDLVSIRDNGHYFYALRLRDGKKTQVMKYLGGIAPLLTQANAAIAANKMS
jgi:hypothetical protein